MEEELLQRLGEIVADLPERRAWSTLSFAGTERYAERRPGLSKTTVEDRVRVERSLLRFPLLREACRGGQIGFEALVLVSRGARTRSTAARATAARRRPA